MLIPLTADDIRELHDYALDQDGGLPGEREPGYVDFIAQKPFQGLFGSDEDAYPGLFMKAAVYMHSLATGHCFNDANKRTSYLAAFAFLKLNEYTLVIEDDVVFHMTLDVANKKLPVEGLAEILEFCAYPNDVVHKIDEQRT